MRRLLIGVCAVLGALTLAMNDARAQAPGSVNLVYTYHVFAYDDTSSLIEFDYQFSDHGLTYVKENGTNLGRLYLRLTVWDSLGKRMLETDWITNSAQPGEGEEPQSLLGLKYLALRPGAYRAQIYYEDLGDSRRRDSAQFPMTVRGFRTGAIDVSDIQIAAELKASEETENLFYKNGHLVYPNVPAMIAPPFLLLSTYLEVYNANRVPSSEFDITYSLADTTRRIFYQRDVRRTRTQAPAVLELHSIPLEELPSGSYYLVVKAYNGLRRSATDSAIAIRAFSIVNPVKDSIIASRQTIEPPTTAVIDPLLAGLSEAELDVEFSKAYPIATEGEKGVWSGIRGVEPKARFLTTFWLRRDETPGTPTNEYRDGYYRRVDRARALYATSMVPNGWETDRGRILLQYGEPDGVDRHPHDPNRKPYEIWTYSRDNIQFVFVDRTQTGRYNLVHSTAPREVKNDDWEMEHATFLRPRDTGVGE